MLMHEKKSLFPVFILSSDYSLLSNSCMNLFNSYSFMPKLFGLSKIPLLFIVFSNTYKTYKTYLPLYSDI